MDRSALEEAWRAERNPKVRERILIVMKLKEGLSSCEIAKQHNCGTSKVFYWRDRFVEEGLAGLQDRPKSGRPPEVSRGEMERVRKVVEAKEYTTTTEVLNLIHEMTGVRYSVMHVTRILHSWGLSRKRLRKRHVNAASERQVRRFKKKAREAIARALERGWTVVCEDESIFTYDSILRCVWARRGSEPFVLTTGSHRHSCVFGALSIDGRQLFRQRSNIDGESFLEYLKELKRKFAPMLLFLDKSGPHHRDEEVRKFLLENCDCIEVMWFPKARPELNPVEECWRQSKDIVLANHVYPSFEEMERRISRILRTRRFRLNIVEYLC